MNKLAYKEDCKILRGEPGRPGFIMLIDCEGDEVFTAPDSWTDEQVWDALEIANGAFAKGVRSGRHSKALEIKRALESA